MEVKILERYRDEEFPALQNFKGQAISSLSKEELVQGLESLEVDGLKLCRLGLIDPVRENLCKILHFALTVSEECQPGPSEASEPPMKKRKVPDSQRSVLIQNATKVVDVSTQTKSTVKIPTKLPVADISLNDPLISVKSYDSDRDPEWTPDDEIDYEDEINESDTINEESNEAREKKYIVFESCLDEIPRKFVEFGCDGYIKNKTVGTCIIVTASCLKRGFIRNWTSLPMTGTIPYGNLILNAAVTFCGASPVECLRMLKLKTF